MKTTNGVATAIALVFGWLQPGMASAPGEEILTPAADIVQPAPRVLEKAAGEIQTALQALDRDLADLARRLATLDPASTEAREGLRQVSAKHPFVTDLCFVSPTGLMTVVEPAAYQHFEGTDISQQAQVIAVQQTRQPVMSQSFQSVEGFPGVDLEYPVLDGGTFKGSVSAFFRPDAFIGGIAAPLGAGSPLGLLAMQNDGTSLYDSDPAQVGKNLFTDPLYQPFPELIELGRAVAAQPSGSGRYAFYATGTTNRVEKQAHWTTVSLHGTEWKIVEIQPLPSP